MHCVSDGRVGAVVAWVTGLSFGERVDVGVFSLPVCLPSGRYCVGSGVACVCLAFRRYCYRGSDVDGLSNRYFVLLLVFLPNSRWWLVPFCVFGGRRWKDEVRGCAVAPIGRDTSGTVDQVCVGGRLCANLLVSLVCDSCDVMCLHLSIL